jgi:hypothetical protein
MKKWIQSMKDFLSVITRMILGGIFVVAGFAKLLDGANFLTTVQRLGFVPVGLILPSTTLIVQSEIWLGLALFVGFRTRMVAALLSGLISVFVLVIVVALLRGTVVECGCFGYLDSEKIGIGVIIRDMLLLGSCIWISLRNEESDSVHRATAEDEIIDHR